MCRRRMTRTVLIIDDNPAVGEALSLALSLHAIRERHPDLPVILLTAWTHLETAVELVKAGAADYLAKPWDDNKLLATVENLLELSESSREITRSRRERSQRREALRRKYDLDGLVFASEAMARTLDLACQVARSDVSVLITGPNGTGKERIATIMHANSPVARGPFIAVNCGALPGELIEAGLFGGEAGAYTGAKKARAARFGQDAPGQGAGAQRDQCRPQGDDPRRYLPRGSVLPTQRDRGEPAAAQRAQRRHPAAGRVLPRWPRRAR